MNRTRVDALVLVNWKGVFYQRYLFHRHVTALEGSNGAGKTTVMIAAYVVLLPDMSRLRFTNLGESGATGGDKGIYGRLGESGRPSYAAMDFVLADGGRLVAGVHLERKGEPTVEPTAFVVSGLGRDVRLQDLMLLAQGDDELVPELPELRENAARLGGRLQVFTSARDYFAALFDEGVTPLRLGTDEERNKLNEMLRTSMTGGISRALTSELRAFLLKEESGLAETLHRMKANLDACRRTRTEVQESRRLEQEIGGVFEAGHTMFTAAFLATRERADELERRVIEAQASHTAAVEARSAAEDALARISAELESIETRRAEAEAVVEAARAWQGRVRAAFVAANELADCVTALERAVADARSLADARATASHLRDVRRDELRRAQEGYKRAASGLADVQRGIEELHRRAGAYHQAVRRQREAEERLGTPIAIDELDEGLALAREELARVDHERREAGTRLADADDHRRRHAEVMAALRELAGHDVDPEVALVRATSALRRHRDQRVLAERTPALAEELGEARRMSERQGRARSKAETLGVEIGPESAAATVRALLDETEATRAQHEADERSARTDIASAERTQRELETQKRELLTREPQWREYDACAARLAAHVGFAIVCRPDLDRARAALVDELTTTRRAEETAAASHERLLREAHELLAAGGAVDPELLRLKDQLGADLVATSFEDVDVAAAGVLEARLGSLARALVVDEPASAARSVRGRSAALGDVLFVSREANLEALASAATHRDDGATDVLVQESVALRVSRIPDRPRLGRRAREARAAELRAEAARNARALDEIRTTRRLLERHVSDGESLLAGQAIWLSGDPAAELSDLARKISESAERLETLHEVATRHGEAARATRPRIDALRALLADAFLLDPPDHAERACALDVQHRAALEATADVARHEGHAIAVEEGLGVLKSRPLSDEERNRLHGHVEELRRDRERLDAAVDALEYLQANSEALGWSHAPARLADTQALVPALQAQLQEAEDSQQQAEQRARDADAHYDRATETWQDADGRRRVAEQQHAAVVARFEAMGVPSPTESAVLAATHEVERADAELRGMNVRRDELLTARGRQESTHRDALERATLTEEKLVSERREAEPAVARWQRLHGLALRHRLVGSTIVPGDIALAGVRGHVNLVQATHTHRALLLDRLRGARGGSQFLAELQILRDAADADFADEYLDLWLAVRDWLRRRLPAQVAEVDDPREALLRLRDQLSGLEDRLTRQESDLRGESEHVARGIDVQVRKARGQVNRLNRNLEGVSFGSIRGIRVTVQPVDRMEQVLRALREGAAQGLLFQEDLPIEDALDQIFQRYGGGRTGGQKLLDYREYVHLQVEVRRSSGVDWEIANPTRLSTGEAIGVGAALMMVVLTEWERDATLLRGRKSLGSLRFLFLDEANRLSHDNLGVLFDLCSTLDLQLLIAAPEVARAEGNTTYRLVRRTMPDGKEAVIVSGRRIRADA